MGDQHETWRSWIPRFDAWAATYDSDTRDPWLSYEAAWAFVERALRSGSGAMEGRLVADVGCGTGEFLGRIVAAGGRGIGIDPSAGMRDAAARKVPAARILDGHLMAIPLADRNVDAVVATYVVSHLEPAEQPAALREFLRVVTSTGTIVVVDVPTVSPAELPRVRSVLAAHGRQAEIEWYERGHGLALADWAAGLTASGRRVFVEPLGPLLVGLAGVATDTRILNDP
jgi:ubiquinone/menaquinone biosynthesis C-methylase UbiE